MNRRSLRNAVGMRMVLSPVKGLARGPWVSVGEAEELLQPHVDRVNFSLWTPSSEKTEVGRL